MITDPELQKVKRLVSEQVAIPAVIVSHIIERLEEAEKLVLLRSQESLEKLKQQRTS